MLCPWIYLSDAHLHCVRAIHRMKHSASQWDRENLHFFAAPQLEHRISQLQSLYKREKFCDTLLKSACAFLHFTGNQLRKSGSITKKILSLSTRLCRLGEIKFNEHMLKSGFSFCKESHLPCLKVARRVSVPYQMPDSLQDWGFQENLAFSRENSLSRMTGKVTRLQNKLCGF